MRPTICILYTLALVVTALFSQTESAKADSSNPNLVAEVTGVIAYMTISDRSFRGEEHWRLLVHPDGSRTSTSSVRLDATEVSRTVTQRVDANMRPIDAYQHLWSGGEFRGAGFFQVLGNSMHVTLTTPNGQMKQVVPVPEHFSWVQHPLGTDGWHMSYYDEAKGGVQKATVYNTHTLGNTRGSILGSVHQTDLELLGTETVTVEAGTFETKKYLLDGRMEIWVEPGDLIMVRMRVESRDRLYELKRLQRTNLN